MAVPTNKNRAAEQRRNSLFWCHDFAVFVLMPLALHMAELVNPKVKLDDYHTLFCEEHTDTLQL